MADTIIQKRGAEKVIKSEYIIIGGLGAVLGAAIGATMGLAMYDKNIRKNMEDTYDKFREKTLETLEALQKATHTADKEILPKLLSNKSVKN